MASGPVRSAPRAGSTRRFLFCSDESSLKSCPSPCARAAPGGPQREASQPPPHPPGLNRRRLPGLRCRTLQKPRSCENICSTGAKNIRSNKNNYRQPRVGLRRRAHTAGTAPGFLRPRGDVPQDGDTATGTSVPALPRLETSARARGRCPRGSCHAAAGWEGATQCVPAPPSASQRVPVHAVPWRSVRPGAAGGVFWAVAVTFAFFLKVQIRI